MITPNIIIVALCAIFTAIIGLYIWTSKTRVDNKVCEVVRQNFQAEHKNLRAYVADTEERSEKRHTELKTDLNEVKELIRNNHH